jgi:hypothetical protein
VVSISLAPIYAGALWLGRKPLMLTVLRGLVRRGSQNDAAFTLTNNVPETVVEDSRVV